MSADMEQIGRPGGSLAGLAGRFGETARAGAQGERDTARLLRRWFPGTDVTVFHDLTMPGPVGRRGERANIDHVVVRGRNVVVVDSKRWRPGMYWTFGGCCFRGLRRFREAESRTVGMAVDRLRPLFGRSVRVRGVLLVHVRGRLSLRWLRVPDGVKVLAATEARPWLWRRLRRGTATPDRRVRDVLEGLTR